MAGPYGANDRPVGSVAGSPQQPQAPRSQQRVLTGPDPRRQAAEDRAAAAEIRAEQANDRADRAEARDQASFDGTGGKPTEAQQKTSILLSRLIRGVNTISNTSARNNAAQSPGVVETLRGNDALMPGGIGGIISRNVAGEDRRIVHDAQRDILDSLLTMATGAAYTPEQLSGQMAAYFPQYGDGEREITEKNNALRLLIESAKANAGPGWAETEAAIAPFLNSLGGAAPTPDGPLDAAVEGQAGLTGSVTDTGEGYDPASIPPDQDGISVNIGERISGPLDALTTLGKQGITLGLSDEAAGVGGFISKMVPGGETPWDAYSRERDVERSRIEQSRKMMGPLGMATEFLGAGGAVRAVPGAVNTLASMTRQGAGFGGAAGFGYGEGAYDSAKGALVSGVGGALIGNALGRLSGAPRGGMPPGPGQLAAIQAGARRKVPMRQADIKPEVRQDRASIRSTEKGGAMLKQAEVEDVAAIEGAVERDLGGAAPAQKREVLGDNLQDALDTYRQTSRQKASALYTRADKMAGGAKATPTNALQEVDNQIAELQASGARSNKEAIAYLQDVKADLSAGGGLSIKALRDMRSNMRGQINTRNLTHTDTERRVGMVMDAASSDIQAALSGNPNALAAYRQADQAWSHRSRFVKQIMEKITGPENNRKSGSAAASALEGWIKGDAKRFQRLWAELDSADREAIQSTVADSLGRNAKGEFSLAEFLSHTSGGKRSTLSEKTARTIFGNDGIDAIKDLRLIAEGKVAAGNATNWSGTTGTMRGTVTGLRRMLLSGFGFTQGGVAGAAIAPMADAFLTNLGQRRAARLLLNSDFTKWLRNAPNTTNPRALDAYFGRLASLTSVAANDNAAIRSAIVNAMKQSPGSATADEE